ncbi:MoxR family ATPase [Oscillibacter sp.]|uniref:MoxR family ATPase n=1 Tax=Oscillibacter sp. TaxID=1945593 RepID=UPI00289C9453|nr:MoxR family ATPase [Oscillibacter sp.]
MGELMDFLRAEGVSEALLQAAENWKNHQSPVREAALHRIPKPRYPYYGKEIWEEAISALLSGEHLLLAGPKATGKNDLAENLSALFGRPQWDVSFYINTDAASLIGTDTLCGGEVSLRHGPIARCALEGGFGVLDEINMAKNESLAVLHAALDFRRCIDVPGYDRIPLSEASRFIATMNYGYAGTRDLNEALASRFLVINMPSITEENLLKLLGREFPELKPAYADQMTSLFTDIRRKCDSAEISTKALDLRGLLAAVRLMRQGLPAVRALELGIVNKCFDEFERQLVEDVVKSRVPEDLSGREAFAL